jgi:hypothetical protein
MVLGNLHWTFARCDVRRTALCHNIGKYFLFSLARCGRRMCLKQLAVAAAMRSIRCLHLTGIHLKNCYEIAREQLLAESSESSARPGHASLVSFLLDAPRGLSVLWPWSVLGPAESRSRSTENALASGIKTVIFLLSQVPASNARTTDRGKHHLSTHHHLCWHEFSVGATALVFGTRTGHRIPVVEFPRFRSLPNVRHLSRTPASLLGLVYRAHAVYTPPGPTSPSISLAANRVTWH